MLIIRISLDGFGEDLSPSKMLEKINEKIKVISSQEPILRNLEDDLMGFISITKEEEFCLPENIEDYNCWYVEFVEKYYDLFILNKAEDIRLSYDVYYTKQCNFEILNLQLLNRLMGYKISIPVSTYQISELQMKELLLKNGMNEVQYNLYKEQFS